MMMLEGCTFGIIATTSTPGDKTELALICGGNININIVLQWKVSEHMSNALPNSAPLPQLKPGGNWVQPLVLLEAKPRRAVDEFK